MLGNFHQLGKTLTPSYPPRRNSNSAFLQWPPVRRALDTCRQNGNNTVFWTMSSDWAHDIVSILFVTILMLFSFLVITNLNRLYLNLHAVVSLGNYLMFIIWVSGKGEGQRFRCKWAEIILGTSLTLFATSPLQLWCDFPAIAIPCHFNKQDFLCCFKGQTPSRWRAGEVCFSCGATWAHLPWQCCLFQVYLGASRWHQCPCSGFHVQVMAVLHVEIPVPTNNLEFCP